MSWTRTGTINVTNGSANVVGVGTAWLADGLTKEGDTLIVGGEMYEVAANATADDALTITPVYAGATAAGLAYAIIHTGLLPAALAKRLAELQSRYLATISQLVAWENETSGTVPITNPGTGITTYVTPLQAIMAVATGALLPALDSTAIVKGSLDPSKQVRMDVSAVSTGTVRVITMPNKNGTLAMTSDIGTAGALTADTDTALTANSDTKLATQKAVKSYVDTLVTGGAVDVMIFKGVIDCSANPNYPAADAGNLYKVSVAGKIGGASGVTVEIGDTLYCITDATASGDQATVGAHWNIAEANKVTQPYDLPGYYPGIPPANAYFYRGRGGRALTLDPALMSGTLDTDASAAATGTYVVTLKAAGSAKATATWTAGNIQATLATTGGTVQTIAKGDLIEIIGQATPDATLANPSWTVLATR